MINSLKHRLEKDMLSMVHCFKRGVWVSIEKVVAILKDLYSDSWEEEGKFLLDEGYILENKFLNSEECLVGYKPIYLCTEEANYFALNDWSNYLEIPANKTYPEKYVDFFTLILYDLGEEVQNYLVQYYL